MESILSKGFTMCLIDYSINIFFCIFDSIPCVSGITAIDCDYSVALVNYPLIPYFEGCHTAVFVDVSDEFSIFQNEVILFLCKELLQSGELPDSCHASGEHGVLPRFRHHELHQR